MIFSSMSVINRLPLSMRWIAFLSTSSPGRMHALPENILHQKNFSIIKVKNCIEILWNNWNPCIMPTVPACGTHPIFIQILLKYRKNPDFKPILCLFWKIQNIFLFPPYKAVFYGIIKCTFKHTFVFIISFL